MGSPPFYAGLFLSSNLLRFPHIRPAHPRQSASNNSTLKSDQFGRRYPWFPFVLAPLSLCSQPHRDYLSNNVDNFDNILINKQTIRWEKNWQFWQYLDPESKQWDKKGYLTIALCSKTIIRLTISFLVVTSAMKPPCEHFLSAQYEHQLLLVQPDMQKTENRANVFPTLCQLSFQKAFFLYFDLRHFNANSGVLRCFLVLILLRQKVG